MATSKPVAVACAGIAALLGASADAATITWTNAAGGSYDTAGNWSTATVPTTTSDVVFNLNNTYTVNFGTSNRTNISALVDGGNVTFNLGGSARNYTLTGNTYPGSALLVGNTSTAELTLTNGKLSLCCSFTTVGNLTGSNGTLNLSTGATLQAATVVVGNAGTGSVAISNGGVVTSADLHMGWNVAGNGTVTVNGAGSQWTVSSQFFVGRSGTGILAISNGGKVTHNGVDASIGYDAGSSGTVTVDGAGSQLTLLSGELGIGRYGTGSLAISNGGVVTSGRSSIAQVAGSSGTVTVDGTGSSWTSSDLDVGAGGAGSLSISNGGAVTTSHHVRLGSSVGSNGTLTVAGLGSTLSAGDLAVGGGLFGAGGTGLLDINSGGAVNVAGPLKIWNAGTVNVNNGTLAVSGSTTITGGSLDASGGTFTSGGLTLNGGSLTVTTLGGLGAIAFNAGTLNTGSLNFGAGGPLGSNYTLGSGRNLNVTNATTIDVGSTLIIDGGNFTTGSLIKNGTFQFLSGTMDLGSTVLSLGAGDVMTVGVGSSFVNTGSFTVGTGSSFLVNGGTFSSDSLAVNGGAFNLTSGLITVTGNATVGNGGVLNLAGGTLDVGAILGINAGGTVSGSGTFTGGSVVVRGNLNLTGDSDFQVGTVLVGDFFGGGTGQISIADATTTEFQGTVIVNGNGISVGAGGEAIYNGYLGGGGTLGGAGTHTANGQVGPGNSPGTLTVEGDFVFGDQATFEVELAGVIAGSEYDVMDVAGEAWLDGTLKVTLLDGFTVAAGDSFDVLMAEVLHGSFGSSVLPSLGSSLGWQISYLLDEGGVDTLRLTVVAPIPAAVWMLLSALGALGYARRRQRLH